MTDSSESVNQDNNLIEAYQAAAKRQRLASRSITIAIILTVLVFVFLIWSEFTDFRDNRVEEFGAHLGAEASEFLPSALDSMNGMVNRLVPIYIDSFSNVFIRDEAAYHEIVHTEFSKLDDYAQKEAWPKLENALAQLVIDQEMAMRDTLEEFIEREQVIELSQAYRVALDNYLVNFFEKEFSEQTITGETIIQKLQQLANDHAADAPTDSDYILGMLMELLGLQMQEAAIAEATPISSI